MVCEAVMTISEWRLQQRLNVLEKKYLKKSSAAIYYTGEPIEIAYGARHKGDCGVARKKISLIAQKTAHIMMQVRNRELTFSQGQELLQMLTLECETVRDMLYIEMARDCIVDFKEKWDSVPDAAQYQATTDRSLH